MEGIAANLDRPALMPSRELGLCVPATALTPFCARWCGTHPRVRASSAATTTATLGTSVGSTRRPQDIMIVYLAGWLVGRACACIAHTIRDTKPCNSVILCSSLSSGVAGSPTVWS